MSWLIHVPFNWMCSFSTLMHSSCVVFCTFSLTQNMTHYQCAFHWPSSLILSGCSLNHYSTVQGHVLQTEKHWLNQRGQGLVRIYLLHAHFREANTQICTIQGRSLCCLADGAGMASLNDGEVWVKVAWAMSSLGFFVASASQQDTNVGQRSGNVAYSRHTRKREKKCCGSSLWVDKSLFTFKERYWKQIT